MSDLCRRKLFPFPWPFKYHRRSVAGGSSARGAIVCSGYESAAIGRSIFEKGGSAADAAIATKICEGVTLPLATGLGGGILTLIYEKSKGAISALNAREVAPMCATKDMFHKSSNAAKRGGLSVAVPGELIGYYEIHKQFGCLEWKQLVIPTIEVCRRGHLVTPFLERVCKINDRVIRGSPTLSKLFINPETGQTYVEGDYLKREKLAETLEVIAEEGPLAVHNGSLTKGFVEDIEAEGGIITVEDMNNYKAEWMEPVVANLPNEQKLYTMPLPGSGTILIFILNILKGHLVGTNPECVQNMHRIVETFKYGYGKRSELGDLKFVENIRQLVTNLTSEAFAAKFREKISDSSTFQDPAHYGAGTDFPKDFGTNHICILAPNGDAVSMTGSINLSFGAGFLSKSTSIILNNHMDDFSAPDIVNSYGYTPSPSNFIVPGKRPMSSMCPSIILDEHGDVKMIIGAAGGSKIITSIALVILRHLWFSYPLEKAVDTRRYHHQLCPMKVTYEDGYNADLIDALSELGHDCEVEGPSDGFAALNAICRCCEVIEAVSDVRRGGSVDFLK